MENERKNVSVDLPTHEAYRQLAHDEKTSIAKLLREAYQLLLKARGKSA